MVINHIFDHNLVEAKKYFDLVKKLFVTNKKGEYVLPFYYYVPADLIEIERVEQGTQKRLPSPEIENDSSHLWTQSIVFICELLGKASSVFLKLINSIKYVGNNFIILFQLVDKLLLLQDLDPIRRYLQPSERPKQSKRYSTFKVYIYTLDLNPSIGLAN